MTDPVSVTGLALQVALTLKQLYDYGKQVKGAQSDIRHLCLELSALRSLLNDVRDQGTPVPTQSTLFEALHGAQITLHELSGSLAPPSSSYGRVKQSLAWPFKEDEVTKALERLERAKTLLMLCLMGDFRTVQHTTDELKESIGRVLANQEHNSDAEYHKQVTEWIGPLSPNFAHNKACAIWANSDSGLSLVKGTIQTMSAWRMMALIGISGTGKSTLFSRIVAHLTTTSTPNVAHIYCMYNDTETQSVERVLGTWIAQLWSLKPRVLERFRSHLVAREPVPTGELSAALIEIAESAGHVTLAIDALNECRDSVKLASVLLDLVHASPAINVLVSTTPSDPAEAHLCSQGTCRRTVLTAERMNPDIEEYIRREIAKHPVMKRMDEQEILDQVLRQANGTFKWASCQMGLLAEQATPKKVRKALGQLPQTLNETYMALLHRVSESCKDVVREVLVWLSLSQRPLKLGELVEIAAFESDESCIDDDCRIQPPAKLVEMCHGLVVIDSATNIATLAHGSVRSFLTSDYIRSSPVAYYAIDESNGHASLVTKCLSYLLMDTFNLGLCAQETCDRLQEEFPLLNYASIFWPQHAAAQAMLTPEQLDTIQRFFWTHRSGSDGGNFTFWVNCMVPEATEDVIEVAEPLYYGASLGLTQVVESMLQNGWISREDKSSPWFIDHRCGRGASTALQVACWRGHTAIVILLLEAGADPDSKNIVGATSLYCARRQGHADIERLLMEVGATEMWQPEAIPNIHASAVRSAILQVLDSAYIDTSDISDTTMLGDLGVDSMIAVEISRRIKRETGLDVAPLFLLMNKTIKEIEQNVATARLNIHDESEDHTQSDNEARVNDRQYPGSLSKV